MHFQLNKQGTEVETKCFVHPEGTTNPIASNLELDSTSKFQKQRDLVIILDSKGAVSKSTTMLFGPQLETKAAKVAARTSAKHFPSVGNRKVAVKS